MFVFLYIDKLDPAQMFSASHHQRILTKVNFYSSILLGCLLSLFFSIHILRSTIASMYIDDRTCQECEEIHFKTSSTSTSLISISISSLSSCNITTTVLSKSPISSQLPSSSSSSAENPCNHHHPSLSASDHLACKFFQPVVRIL